MTTRRFTAPWRADKMPDGYVVRDAQRAGARLRLLAGNEAEALQAKVVTADEAQRTAIKCRQAAGAVEAGAPKPV
jgi:hypothetical protein